VADRIRYRPASKIGRNTSGGEKLLSGDHNWLIASGDLSNNYIQLKQSRSTSLEDLQRWVVPAPDGRRVAYLHNIVAANTWLIRFK
jgi:hypothetical protein